MITIDMRGERRVLAASELGPLPVRARVMLALGGTIAATATASGGRGTVTLGVHPPLWLSVLGMKPWTWHSGHLPVAS